MHRLDRLASVVKAFGMLCCVCIRPLATKPKLALSATENNHVRPDLQIPGIKTWASQYGRLELGQTTYRQKELTTNAIHAKEILAHDHAYVLMHANLTSHGYHKTIIVPPSCVLVSASYSSSGIEGADKRATFNKKHLHHAVEEVAIAKHVPAQRCVSKHVGL